MPSNGKYPDELRERAVRMVLDHGHEYGSQWEAICSVAEKLGPKPETVRLWVRQAEKDTGRRPGATTAELVELKRLKRENAELRRANDMADSTGQRNDTSELAVSSPRRKRCKVSMDICRWSRSSTRFGCVREDGVSSTSPGRSGAPPPWSVSWFVTEGTLMPSRSAGSPRLGA